MTWRARLFGLFPAIFILGAIGTLGGLIWNPCWITAAYLPVHLYLLPPLCYRLHHLFWPLREGLSPLDVPNRYVPWWGGHMFQLPYGALPQLEAVLRLFPGLYSLWLRLWGARVGRNVHWTPLVEIADRGMLDIGDNTVVGHRCGFYAHLVSRKDNGQLRLYVRRIHIGKNVLLGAGSRFGPGAQVADDTQLPACTDLWVAGLASTQDHSG